MKKKILSAQDLDDRIAELEKQAAFQKRDIEESFKSLSEDLKPGNLVKEGMRSVFSSNINAGGIVNALLSVGSGFIGRKLLLGKSGGVIGKAVQWGLAGVVSKNADKIKEKAGELIDRFFKKSNKSVNHSPAFPVDSEQIK